MVELCPEVESLQLYIHINPAGNIQVTLIVFRTFSQTASGIPSFVTQLCFIMYFFI